MYLYNKYVQFVVNFMQSHVVICVHTIAHTHAPHLSLESCSALVATWRRHRVLFMFLISVLIIGNKITWHKSISPRKSRCTHHLEVIVLSLNYRIRWKSIHKHTRVCARVSVCQCVRVRGAWGPCVNASQ